MRETHFIKQNKEKWSKFEQLLKAKKKDLDKLSDLFVQTMDDLSYARTFYRNRSVRVYLNGLAQQLFHSIYKNKRARRSHFINFWKIELPQIVYTTRHTFLTALIVFVLSFCIGMLSTAMDEDFPRTILGDGYIYMTESNIERGDPMAVYKQVNEVEMFFGITYNNVRVAFLVFVLGIFFGIGSIGIMVFNGIMVGTFQYYFYQKGLFVESFLTIWIHGTLEISAIIIAGAAGIVLGRGLAFPGTYSRLQAFQISARRGLKILMGTVPIFIFAGFAEGFITRHTETPDALRLAVILLSLTFILGYFVWYPFRLARKGFARPVEEVKLPPTRSWHIDYQGIKNNGEVLLDTFVFLRKHLRKLVLLALGISGAYTLFVGLSASDNFFGELYGAEMDDTFGIVGEIIAWCVGKVFVFFDYSEYPLLLLVNVLWSTLVVLFVSFLIRRDVEGKQESGASQFRRQFGLFCKRHGLRTLIILTLANLVFLLPIGVWGNLFFIFLGLPTLITLAIFINQETLSIGAGVQRLGFVLQQSWGRLLIMNLILVYIAILLLIFISTPIFWMYLEYFNWSFNIPQDILARIVDLFSVLATVFALCLSFLFTIAGFSFLYFTLVEIKEAHGLRQRLEHLGERRRAYGVEQER